jgi:hypothetical protein
VTFRLSPYSNETCVGDATSRGKEFSTVWKDIVI